MRDFCSENKFSIIPIHFLKMTCDLSPFTFYVHDLCNWFLINLVLDMVQMNKKYLDKRGGIIKYLIAFFCVLILTGHIGLYALQCIVPYWST